MVGIGRARTSIFRAVPARPEWVPSNPGLYPFELRSRMNRLAPKGAGRIRVHPRRQFQVLLHLI